VFEIQVLSDSFDLSREWLAGLHRFDEVLTRELQVRNGWENGGGAMNHGSSHWLGSGWPGLSYAKLSEG
jgi:hypothetical protein